jgi:hypothetical protein
LSCQLALAKCGIQRQRAHPARLDGGGVAVVPAAKPVRDVLVGEVIELHDDRPVRDIYPVGDDDPGGHDHD